MPSPSLRAGTVAAAVAAGSTPSELQPDFADARPSAVLAVVADGPQGAEVLLTRRSMEMRSHRGEVSFPGGRLDPGESYVQAALREAHEEVGLHPDAVEVVGELHPLGTWVSRSWIVPIVARLAEPLPLAAPLHGRTSEVDRVLWVPLHDLTRPGTFREEWWHTPIGERPIYFFELDDETVWGATARVLHQLLRVAHGRTSEVDRVLWVPLHDLTRPGTFREEWWHTPIGERPIYFFELDDETVWGATARVLHQLLRVAHGIADLDDAARPPAL